MRHVCGPDNCSTDTLGTHTHTCAQTCACENVRLRHCKCVRARTRVCVCLYVCMCVCVCVCVTHGLRCPGSLSGCHSMSRPNTQHVSPLTLPLIFSLSLLFLELWPAIGWGPGSPCSGSGCTELCCQSGMSLGSSPCSAISQWALSVGSTYTVICAGPACE